MERNESERIRSERIGRKGKKTNCEGEKEAFWRLDSLRIQINIGYWPKKLCITLKETGMDDLCSVRKICSI